MGRGQGQESAAAGFAAVLGPRFQKRPLTESGQPVLSKSTTRNLANRNFVADKDEWKRQEAAYIESVMESLDTATANYAADDNSWQAFLKLYAQTPEYSALNNLWARVQLEHKEAPSEGVILSESAWAALGRRPKAEYCSPKGRAEARRDKKYGYDKDREWDDRYAVEMMQPLGFHGYYKELKDDQGNPILDASGQPKRKFVPIRPRGYKAFVAYHEDATEALDGGPAPALPEPPWAQATGSEEDAQKLLADVKRCAQWENIELVEEAPEQARDRNGLIKDWRDSAKFDPAQRSLAIDPSQPPAEQAVSALRALCQACAGEERVESVEEKQLARAADESAKYVIASLYGLDSDEQTFPHLAAIREMNDGLAKLNSRTHRRVKNILSHIDPKMRAKARAQEEGQASRASRRRQQKSN